MVSVSSFCDDLVSTCTEDSCSLTSQSSPVFFLTSLQVINVIRVNHHFCPVKLFVVYCKNTDMVQQSSCNVINIQLILQNQPEKILIVFYLAVEISFKCAACSAFP